MLKPGQTNGPLTVISYVDAMNVLVEFAESGNRRWTTAQYFRNLAVSDRAALVDEKIQALRQQADQTRENTDKVYAEAIAQAEREFLAAKAKAENNHAKALERSAAQAAEACDLYTKHAAKQKEEFERAAAAAGAGPHVRPGAEVLVGNARTPHIVKEYTPGLLVELINPRSGVTTRAKPHIVHAKED